MLLLLLLLLSAGPGPFLYDSSLRYHHHENYGHDDENPFQDGVHGRQQEDCDDYDGCVCENQDDDRCDPNALNDEIFLMISSSRHDHDHDDHDDDSDDDNDDDDHGLLCEPTRNYFLREERGQ